MRVLTCCRLASAVQRRRLRLEQHLLEVSVGLLGQCHVLEVLVGLLGQRCKCMTALLSIAGRAARNSWKVIAPRLRSNIVSPSSCRRLSHCCREELRKRSTTCLSWSTDGILADDADDLRRDAGSRMGPGWALDLAGAQVFCVREQGTLSFPVKSEGTQGLHVKSLPGLDSSRQYLEAVSPTITTTCLCSVRTRASRSLNGSSPSPSSVRPSARQDGVRALRTAASFLAMPRFTDGTLSSLARTQLLFSGAYVARVCGNA